MGSGLWGYTGHPNYFGDSCVWWGIWVVALATGSAWWTAVGPAVMSVLLIRVSGAAPARARSLGWARGYADYVARTSAFFSRPPRRG